MAETPELQERGRVLFEALATAGVNEGVKALALEAGRLVDRLDELDRIISGRSDFVELMRFRLHERWGEEGDRTVAVEVKFDSVLAEARQQASTLRAVLATLGVTDGALMAPAPTGGGTGLDELARRRASRR